MKIEDIKTPKDVYDFLDENIEYGWIDFENNIHLNTIKDFRRIYKTMYN